MYILRNEEIVMEPCKYIIANKEQELDVLSKLEKEGFKWSSNARPQDLLPSKEVFSDFGVDFPYTIAAYKDKIITWSSSLEDPKGKVVFDGRKEEKMTGVKKYKVTKEFIDELVAWRDERELDATSGSVFTTVGTRDLDNLPNVAQRWRLDTNEPIERNNRTIAIIQWLNGESVFDVEKPHKFVVRTDTPDSGGDYWYVSVNHGWLTTVCASPRATKFDTYEEAKEWASSHQVVVEVDEDGKEV